MIKHKYITVIFSVFISFQAIAQDTYPERAKAYVQEYAQYAIADQKASGVPAAITLAQGILETEAGVSELMVKANNHFGIKCKNDWRGETILHTDDAKDECFKKYKCAQDSYNDHSSHLHRNPRYHPLFGHEITDYKKWAHGLKKCGYATNPKYAYELIKIIEEYSLQQYTVAALDTASDIKTEEPVLVAAPQQAVVKNEEEKKIVPQPIATTPVATAPVKTTTKIIASVDTVVQPAASSFDEMASMADSAKAAIAANRDASTSLYPDEQPITDTGKILTVNGLKAIYCQKDEILLQYAVKYNIRYPHLLEMNDLADEPLAFDSYIYLEKKNVAGVKDKHVVKEGETLLMIAQTEGIQLKKLAALNLLTIYDQPKGGTVLQLQTPATEKPQLETASIKDYTSYQTETALALNVTDTAPEMANTVAAQPSKNTSTEEVSFGMGFGGPSVTEVPQQQDTVQKKTAHEIAKQPFMREDPPQMQLKKPATEPDYKTGDKYYIVKRGETAFSIAKRYGITVEQLLNWNKIEAQDLKAGQTLIVKE